MRFSFIATAVALALTVDASQLSRREVSNIAFKCASSIKAVSDYLPTFTRSIEKVNSYTSVIAAHSIEDKVERKIRTAIKNCSKVTTSTEEEVEAFTETVKTLVDNIKMTTDALNKKKPLLEAIPLAYPLLEDSLLTIYEDAVTLEDHLIQICADKYKEEFERYIQEINDAIEGSMKHYDVKK